jgi:hypothetical protein
MYKGGAIEMASAMVAERQDGTRVFLRYFPTGEVQQWSQTKNRWVTLGTCSPHRSDRRRPPNCGTGPLRLLNE